MHSFKRQQYFRVRFVRGHQHSSGTDVVMPLYGRCDGIERYSAPRGAYCLQPWSRWHPLISFALNVAGLWGLCTVSGGLVFTWSLGLVYLVLEQNRLSLLRSELASSQAEFDRASRVRARRSSPSSVPLPSIRDFLVSFASTFALAFVFVLCIICSFL